MSGVSTDRDMLYSFLQCNCKKGVSFPKQNSTTSLGIIDMRLKNISYDDCCNHYGVGNSTVNLIMSRYDEKGIPLDILKQMRSEEVDAIFYLHRKSEDIMPD